MKAVPCWKSEHAELTEPTDIVLVNIPHDGVRQSRSDTTQKKDLLANRQAPGTLGTCPRARRVCRLAESTTGASTSQRLLSYPRSDPWKTRQPGTISSRYSPSHPRDPSRSTMGRRLLLGAIDFSI